MSKDFAMNMCKNSVFIVFGVLLAMYLSACAPMPNQLSYSTQDSEYLGFTVSGGSVLSNPPRDRARIYFGRKPSFIGVAISYKVHFAYNPPANGFGSYRVYKEMAQGDFGTLSSGAKFVADVGAGVPLAVFASTEETSYIVFTPLAGRIYCIEGEVIAGNFIGRPNLHFADKVRCEALFRK